MTYAIAALLGAVAVWLTQKLTRRATAWAVPFDIEETNFVNLSTGAGDWERFGVRKTAKLGELPTVVIAHIPKDEKVVPTWLGV